MKSITVLTICLLMAVPASMMSMAEPFPVGTFKKPEKQERKQAELSARVPVERHEFEIEKLLRKASRAEEKAAWHAQQAKAWDDVAQHQNSLGDFASAKEPMAGFLAHLHREQHEQSLRQTEKAKQSANQLKERAEKSLLRSNSLQYKNTSIQLRYALVASEARISTLQSLLLCGYLP